MAFNDERVVRRIAALRVPSVSAVGHEIDTTLTDLVADVRAATPSEAAELVVPEARERLARVEGLRRRLARAMRARLVEDGALTQSLRARLSDPRFVIAQHQQGLDEQCNRAERALGRRLALLGNRIKMLHRRLLSRHPRLVVLGSRSALGPLEARLRSVMEQRLAREKRVLGAVPARLRSSVRVRLRSADSRLESISGRLEALSPLTVLARGYAIVTDSDGHVVTDQAAVAAGDRLLLRLHAGKLAARVLDATEEEA